MSKARIVIDTNDGELVIGETGVEFAALRESAPVSWEWPQVHHLAFEAGDGRGPFRRGLIGLMTRPRSRVFLTTGDGDITFTVGQDIGAMRAVARRILVDAPAAAGKVSVAGEVLGR